MEILVELIVQFVGEVLLQIVFQVLAELGLRGLRRVTVEIVNPWVAVLFYVLLGAGLGWLSVQILPSLLLASRTAQLANLVVTPILAGLSMVALGAWRRRREQTLIRLDGFAYGYLFALSMAVIRYQLGD